MVSTPEGIDLAMDLAGYGSRFAALLFDQMLQWLLMLPLVLLLSAAGGIPSSLAVAVVVIVVFLIQFGYPILFEVLNSGVTPGKRLVGIRVVNVDGSAVGTLASTIRNLLRLIDAQPGFGYLIGSVAFIATERSQRLGDLAAGTLVVRTRSAGTQTTLESHQIDPEALAQGARWDIGGVTRDEFAMVGAFVGRAHTLDPSARAHLAAQMGRDLRPKVVGAPPEIDDERFLYILQNLRSANDR